MLLGIDLGTTGIKAVVLREDGSLAASAGQEYDSLYPRPGWVEQDPVTWVRTMYHVVRALWAQDPSMANQITAIGFSGQMHGLVLTNQAGDPLRPVIIWADGRSQAQVDHLVSALGRDEISRMTGGPVFPGFMLPSLLWVRENEPQIWQTARRALLPKDYLRFVLTRHYAAEPSDASSTALLDITRRSWSGELLERMAIPPEWLPEIMRSDEPAGRLLAEPANEMGLKTGIPVVCGGSDQACQALGNGIIRPGEVSATIGTGGQVFAPLSAPRPDAALRLHLFCHVLPGMWHLEAATLSAGLSLRWLRSIAGEAGYQQMADAAAGIPPGSEGLLFAPFLQGERTPYMDAQIRGSWVGLSIRHGLAHLTRSVMEGVVFSIRCGLELISKQAGPFPLIHASGGATRHPLWLQLLADICGKPVVTIQTPEPAASGAAMLAGIGTGVFLNFDDAVSRVVRKAEPIHPNPANISRYEEQFQLYQTLYEHLKPFSFLPG